VEDQVSKRKKVFKPEIEFFFVLDRSQLEYYIKVIFYKILFKFFFVFTNNLMILLKICLSQKILNFLSWIVLDLSQCRIVFEVLYVLISFLYRVYIMK